jgi:hypothetical protein
MALRVRRERSQTRRKFRLHKPQWIDPFPQIPGTEPEKRIFAALVARGVYFVYQDSVPEASEEDNRYISARPMEYVPDFVLPEYRVVIDPFSPFHHSLHGAVETDTRKIALHMALGYRYYHPWALDNGVFLFDQSDMSVNALYNFYNRSSFAGDIRRRAMGATEVLATMPELKAGPRHKLTDPRDVKAKLSPGYRLGPGLGLGANSVASANRKRRKPPKLTLRSSR